MNQCWEFAEEIPGQSTDALSHAAADNNVHLIAGICHPHLFINSFISLRIIAHHHCGISLLLPRIVSAF